ncbi:hypothetical protein VTI74DRAFT_6475 [Chaetomium olivicolor]
MSWFKSLAVAAALVDTASSDDEACEKLAQYVPESFALEEVVEGAEDVLENAPSAKPRDTSKARQQLLAVLACLRCDDGRVRGTAAGQAAALELSRIVAAAIAPVAAQDDDGPRKDEDIPAALDEELKQARRQLVEHCRSVSELGLKVLEALIKQFSPGRLDDEVLLTLLALTDEAQEWSNPEIATISGTLLEQYFNTGALSKEQFITDTVLQRYLRPLFSRSKPASITASGRKAAYADNSATHGQIPDDTAVTKPWKYTDLRAIPAAAWAVHEADTQLVAKHWPLFIPVLLTLADDGATPIRRQGLLILAAFLSKFPDKTLHDTGLAQVFEDAVFPTLSFLPNLTPDDESVQLLVPAYAALLTLAIKQPVVGKDGVVGGKKNELLDKMIREGVFMGYFHAKEHVRIVEVLCRETVGILNEMGVHAVKHLKDLVPMLSSILTDPFAPVSPATLLAAIRALQAVLANCWPRIPGSPWQDEIINALVLCWLHLAEHNRPFDDGGSVYTAIEQELLTSSKALAAVLKTGSGEGAINLASHVAPLLAKEPRLGRLFSYN